MEPEIRFTKSAFKHHFTEADIRAAIKNFCYYGLDEGSDNDDQYLLLGFDRSLRLLEILYRQVGENGMLVFHAMKCQDKNLHYIEG
jgi:hypothetical protein